MLNLIVLLIILGVGVGYLYYRADDRRWSTYLKDLENAAQANDEWQEHIDACNREEV